MSITISTTVRQARNNALLTLLTAGGSSAPAYTEFRTGTRPDISVAATGTLVATATWATTPATLNTDGTLTIKTGADVLAVADGAPTWARTYNGNGVVLFDGDVSVPNGTGDWWLSAAGSSGTSTQVYAGGVIEIASGTLS